MRFGFLAPLLLVSCGADSEEPASSCADVEVLVAASNYQESVVCGAPGCVKNEETTGSDLGADPTLAFTNGRAFYIARDNDLLFELDPACGTPAKRSSLTALAPTDTNGSRIAANPHDVAAAPDGTLVAPLYAAGVLAFIPPSGEPIPLALGQYDPDGKPQPESVRVVEVGGSPKAFVALERLDDTGKGDDYLSSKQASQMLRVDVATRKVEAVIDFAGRNPFGPMAEHDRVLYLAMPGNMFLADDVAAGIERFDTRDSSTRLLVSERTLGASVLEVAVTDGCGAAIVMNGKTREANPTSVITFDPTTGAVGPGRIFGPTPDADLRGIAWRGDTLYVGDRRQGSGGYPVHVFERTSGCTVADSGRTIDLPQRPVALQAAHR